MKQSARIKNGRKIQTERELTKHPVDVGAQCFHSDGLIDWWLKLHRIAATVQIHP